MAAGADDAPPAEPPKPSARPAGSRSLRGRGSSRSRKPVAKVATPEPQSEPPAEARQPASPRPSADRPAGPRSVRGRGGSRGRKAPEATPAQESPAQESPAKEPPSRTSDRLPALQRTDKSADRPAARARADQPADRPRQTRKPPMHKRHTTSRSDAMTQRAAETKPPRQEQPPTEQPASPPESEKESGGLFKRMTAALQKALGEDPDE